LSNFNLEEPENIRGSLKISNNHLLKYLSKSVSFITFHHYKKNRYYRRSKSVGNGQNPSLNRHYQRIIDGQNFVSKMFVDKILSKLCFVGNYRRKNS